MLANRAGMFLTSTLGERMVFAVGSDFLLELESCRAITSSGVSRIATEIVINNKKRKLKFI